MLWRRFWRARAADLWRSGLVLQSRQWSQRQRATGSAAPGKMGGHRKPVLDPHRAFIVERITQMPHLALHGLKAELAARGVKVSHNTVWLFLRREGLRFKKALFALEQARTASLVGDNVGDPGRLDLIRTGSSSSMRLGSRPTWPLLRGWGPKSARLRGFAPHGHWRTLTFLGALRHDQLAAPCVFDRPINGECFCAYVKHILLPTLREGDIVILDNLGSHKSKAVRQMIQTAGARLWYLPPYSPDLNAIEQAFSKIKHWMRQARKRTIEDTRRHIGHLIQDIQPRECLNYFANAGYASVKM